MVKANLNKTIENIAKKQRETRTILELVRNLANNAPRADKKELLKCDYVAGKKCPEWAVDAVLQERGEIVDRRERIDIQNTAQFGNRVLELIASQKREQATEMIVKKVEEENYIYTTREDIQEEVWIYDNGIYVPNGKTHIKEIVREILGMAYTPQLYNMVIHKIEADTYIESKELFRTRHKDEIAVLNGILNIFTKELSPFTPTKIFFNKLPVIYEPSAECPMIDAFLTDVLTREDDKLVFYELGGFALLKEYLFEKAFMFVGNGRNGKGKAIELLKRVVGAENCFSLSLSALCTDNADISHLHNKLLNLAGDIGNNDLKETGLFKSLTGRDWITSKRKYLSALTFENYAKFVFACNDLPMVYDLSQGFWDRWVLLEFPYYFATREEFESAPEEKKENMKIRDEEIISKITTEEELSGLLNNFLKGLERLLKNRRFSYTRGSEEIKNMWIRKSNSFIAFCMDNLEEDYDSKILKSELRRRYSKYCKEHKINGKSDIVVKRFLQEQYGASEEREEVFGKQNYYWLGIKWKENKGK